MAFSITRLAARHSTGPTVPATRTAPADSPLSVKPAATGPDLLGWARSNKDYIWVFVAFTVGSMLLTVLDAFSGPLPAVDEQLGAATAPADDQPDSPPSSDGPPPFV